MGNITSLQAAKKWNISKRQVNLLCAKGLIPGAKMENSRWMIPDDFVYHPRKQNQNMGYPNRISGKYINPIETLDCIKSENSQKQFDKRGVRVEKNFGKLEIQQPELHRLYVLQENKEFVQCVARQGDEILAAVSFDYFNRAPKIGAADLGFITIVGRLMAQIASGLE